MAKPKKRRMKLTDVRWPGPDRGERRGRLPVVEKKDGFPFPVYPKPPRIRVTPAIPAERAGSPWHIFTED